LAGSTIRPLHIRPITGQAIRPCCARIRWIGKARLLTKFEPDSNEFAQQNGVAGMTVYHVVVGEDGKAQQIAVSRPIGFGLDENAVEAIRKASFEPAIKDGKPVPVLVDLVVQFRIFSKRTAVASVADPNGKATESALPGPYGVSHP
jgi:TonB family protein